MSDALETDVDSLNLEPSVDTTEYALKLVYNAPNNTVDASTIYQQLEIGGKLEETEKTEFLEYVEQNDLLSYGSTKGSEFVSASDFAVNNIIEEKIHPEELLKGEEE